MKLVFSSWICLIRFVLEVSVYCIMWKSTVVAVRILTVTIGIIPGSSLFHGEIGRNGGVSFNFYIYFCVCRVWSVKDLVIYFIEKILLFVAPGLAFLNIYIYIYIYIYINFYIHRLYIFYILELSLSNKQYHIYIFDSKRQSSSR